MRLEVRLPVLFDRCGFSAGGGTRLRAASVAELRIVVQLLTAVLTIHQTILLQFAGDVGARVQLEALANAAGQLHGRHGAVDGHRRYVAVVARPSGEGRVDSRMPSSKTMARVAGSVLPLYAYITGSLRSAGRLRVLPRRLPHRVGEFFQLDDLARAQGDELGKLDVRLRAALVQLRGRQHVELPLR